MINKFQKKCFLASAGLHGLLFLVLLVGPAFFISKQEPNDLPTLEFIPSKLIDEKFYRPATPTPEPQNTPAPRPTPVPPPKPKPQPKPPEPKPVKSEPVVKPAPPKPEPKYTKAEDIKVNLSRQNPQPTPQPTPRRDYASAADAIRRTVSSTQIELRSVSTAGGAAYANYAQAVKSIYERNWHPPDETSRDDALVKVQIVIARDGSILSSRIIDRSGDAAVDASVEATLRRVSKVPPFPEGATESKRTYTIGFNLKAKRATG